MARNITSVSERLDVLTNCRKPGIATVPRAAMIEMTRKISIRLNPAAERLLDRRTLITGLLEVGWPNHREGAAWMDQSGAVLQFPMTRSGNRAFLQRSSWSRSHERSWPADSGSRERPRPQELIAPCPPTAFWT